MNALYRLIKTEIETSGPMTVGRYMQHCLSHPDHGYYQTKQPFGQDGDFTTAPEISQLFGELIGAWLVHVWHQLGAPAPVSLVELGPGRGTLMADIWRVARTDSAFAKAVSVHLVETSPPLVKLQHQTLLSVGLEAQHHDSIETLPARPTLWIGNEFLDALPTNQWVRTPRGWNARKVGLDEAGALTFGVDPTPLPAPKPHPPAAPGTIMEHSPVQDAVFTTIAQHIRANGGAALFIDYGSLDGGTGDTLQAVRQHQKVDPLLDPGEVDLTTHIDFAHLARIGHEEGLYHEAATQGAFLLALGLLERAGQLGAGADPADQEAIQLAVERLAGDAGMGQLFKVLALTQRPTKLPGLSTFTPPDQNQKVHHASSA